MGLLVKTDIENSIEFICTHTGNVTRWALQSFNPTPTQPRQNKSLHLALMVIMGEEQVVRFRDRGHGLVRRAVS